MGAIKILFTIPNLVYKRFAKNSETKKVMSVAALENKPLKFASFTSSPRNSLETNWLNGKSIVKNKTEYRIDENATSLNNPDPRTGEHVRTLEWKHMMDPM